MPIVKETLIDQITVTENGIVLYREATRIIENGKELTKTYHRTSLVPGQDISSQPQKVQDICNAAWTEKVIASYQQKVISEQESE